MLKTFLTLVRGAAAAADTEIADRSALLVLDQQIRDATTATERAKRSLALAIAQDEAEGRRLDATLARIADLETRAVAALAADHHELDQEAAEAIALMETDRDAIRAGRAAAAGDISQMRTAVSDAIDRLSRLEQGRRIAQAAEAVRRMKAGSSAGDLPLAEAESTLRRLRDRQREAEDADKAMASFDRTAAAASLAGRLESAGFGPRTRSTAADVLERLKAKMPNVTP